jgi:hypothetical protein
LEGKPQRSTMKPTSEAARRWADGLRAEVEQWPGVVLKRAFGMTLVYRRNVVFAALPGTRALFEEDAILIKFVRETAVLAKRIAAARCFTAGSMEQQLRERKKKQGEGRKWRIYLLREERDAREAVEWLARAYEIASKR